MWHVDDVISLFPFRLRIQNHFHFFHGRMKILLFHSLIQFNKIFTLPSQKVITVIMIQISLKKRNQRNDIVGNTEFQCA